MYPIMFRRSKCPEALASEQKINNCSLWDSPDPANSLGWDYLRLEQLVCAVPAYVQRFAQFFHSQYIIIFFQHVYPVPFQVIYYFVRLNKFEKD